MLERVEINKLYLYQRDLLFLVVFAFPDSDYSCLSEISV